MGTSWSRRVATFTYWLYPRVTASAGPEVAATEAAGVLSDFDGSRHGTVVSFRRTGEPVATPVWVGQGGGRLYFRTLAAGHKVGRIRNNPEVLVAPCTPRGRPTGPPMRARARILDDVEGLAVAEPAIQASFRFGRTVYKRVVQDAEALYVELTPSGDGD
jgi:PPOX class probable F420-dependent enzyme